MGRFLPEDLENTLEEFEQAINELEAAKKDNFISICRMLGGEFDKTALYAEQYGLPRYLACAENIRTFFMACFGELFPVLPFLLFENDKLMFSWGRSETDIPFCCDAPIPLVFAWK